MKKLLAFLFIMAVPALSKADTVTPRLSLTEPSINSANWGQKLNNNMGLIDTGVGVLSLTNTWSALNAFPSTTTFGAVTKSTFNANGSLTLGNSISASTASFTGPVTASSGSFANGLTAGAAALTSSLSVVGAATFGNAVSISSNAVLPGATFYQNAPAVISSFTVTTATATWFGATTSSITNITAQNFTAVTSTSTNLNATTFVTSTLTATNVVGQANASAAPAGDVGEIITSSATYNAPVLIATGQKVNVATATLTTGCWQIAFGYGFKSTNASTSVTEIIGTISTVSQTFPTTTNYAVQDSAGQIYMDFNVAAYVPGNGNVIVFSAPSVDVCVASNTTYYGVMTAQFSVSTGAVFGGIHAKRYR